MKSQIRRRTRAILLAALLVGTLDIAAASTLALLRGGNPLSMLRFIASGAFGMKAFAGGLLYSLYGLFFHYLIAMIWTAIFFEVAERITATRRNRIATGILYGIFVWLGMNLIVLPLSNAPALPFEIGSAITASLVLIAAVGIPLAYLSARFFSER